MPDPTDEQRAAVDAFTTGGQVLLEAGAGTGKTSTLRMLAAAVPKKRGIYVAYNKAIADDAKASFPRNVTCATAHALAFRALGYRYKHRLGGSRVAGIESARILGITEAFSAGTDRAALPPEQIARLALNTVQRFCWSADNEPARWHVPAVTGIDDSEVRSDLVALVVPLARKAWNDIQNQGGRLRFEHDHYLKMWQLSDPSMDADYVLFDEAQDANPVVESVVSAQQAQQVYVGDAAQAIYAWRGAENAMSWFRAEHRLSLSTSFRFGPGIAEEANKWLELLRSNLRLTGAGQGAGEVGEQEAVDAVLCRTNSETIAEVMHALGEQVPVAVVGGGREVQNMARAAQHLKDGRGTSHPELCAFATWGQVQDYVDQDGGSDLKVLVDLVDTYGPEAIIDAIERTVDEKQAELTVSTAHKSKGREFDSVRIADDFREPNPAKPLPEAEAMLAYVSVTRARRQLDPGPLRWVDDWLAHDDATPTPSPPSGVDAGDTTASTVTDADGQSVISTPGIRHIAAPEPVPGPAAMTIELSGDVVTWLRQEAARRGQSAEQLARELLRRHCTVREATVTDLVGS